MTRLNEFICWKHIEKVLKLCEKCVKNIKKNNVKIVEARTESHNPVIVLLQNNDIMYR